MRSRATTVQRHAALAAIKQSDAGSTAPEIKPVRDLLEPTLNPATESSARNTHLVSDLLTIAALWAMELRRRKNGGFAGGRNLVVSRSCCVIRRDVLPHVPFSGACVNTDVQKHVPPSRRARGHVRFQLVPINTGLQAGVFRGRAVAVSTASLRGYCPIDRTATHDDKAVKTAELPVSRCATGLKAGVNGNELKAALSAFNSPSSLLCRRIRHVQDPLSDPGGTSRSAQAACRTGGAPARHHSDRV